MEMLKTVSVDSGSTNLSFSIFTASQETWLMLAGPLGTPKDGDTGASWGEWSLEEFLCFDSSPPYHSLLESRFPAEALGALPAKGDRTSHFVLRPYVSKPSEHLPMTAGV